MKQSTQSFNQAIQSIARHLDVKLTFTLEDTTQCVFTSDQVKKLRFYQSSGTEIGGLENEFFEVQLITPVLDSSFNKCLEVTLEIGVQVTSFEYITLGTYLTADWKKDDKLKSISILCISKLSQLIEKNMPFMPTYFQTTQHTYLQSFFSILQLPLTLEAALPNHHLQVAFLQGTQIKDTLRPLCESMNGLLRYRNGFSYINYKPKQTSDLTLDYDTMVKAIKEEKDNTSVYDRVLLTTYLPHTNTYKEQHKIENITVPASHSHFKVGRITFNEPKLIKCIVFHHDIGISDYQIGLEQATLFIQNKGTTTLNTEATFYGSDFTTATLTSTNDTTNRVKTIKNFFLQDALQNQLLDTSVHTCNQVSIKYRGNPCIEVGDTVTFIGFGKVFITEHVLHYEGYLSGELKGVKLSGN